MKRIRLLGLALIAVFALGAFASAGAFAEDPTLLLEGKLPTAAEPATFTSEAPTASSFEQEGSLTKFSCQKATNKGSFTSQDAGKLTIEFKECESSGLKCNSDGTAGVVVASGPVQLVDVLPTGTLDLGIWFEPKNKAETGDLKFICGGLITITKLGSVIGVIDNAAGALLTAAEGEVAKTEVKALWKQTDGVQEIKECMTLKALCEKGPFDMTVDTGKGEVLTGLLGDALIKFLKKVTAKF